MNKVLYVNLSAASYHTEPIDPKTAELFLGGRGFGICFLFEHFKKLQLTGKYENPFAEVNPLSADNVIVIATSPTTGTQMPASGRVHMNYKSPLTGALGSTNAGGRWAVESKKSGYDVLVLTGKSPQPICLVISNAGVEFLEAGSLKNKSGASYQARLKLNLGKFTKKEEHFGIWHAWFWKTGITDSIGALDRQSGGNRQAPGQGLLSIL